MKPIHIVVLVVGIVLVIGVGYYITRPPAPAASQPLASSGGQGNGTDYAALFAGIGEGLGRAAGSVASAVDQGQRQSVSMALRSATR